MKVLHSIAIALVLACSSSATLAAPRVLELTYEAVPSMIQLPEHATGELVFQSCAKCKSLRLRATDKTGYFLGKQQVSLQELKRYLSRTPNTGVTVMRHIDTFDLSRVVVYVPNDAR